MNEIDAIAYFEKLIKYFEDKEGEPYWSEVHNAMSRQMIATALAALREKADREKSEQWCKKETNGGLLAICPKCNYPVSWWHKTPFCANCGKRLEVEHI